MSFKVDFSGIRTVRVHKQQFNEIDKKAVAIILECKEAGRIITFNRADERPKYADNNTAQPWLMPAT